jgi:glycosyltransferase involved in cell wall biosynthesis/4-amino-4-deoxy-L-arabinose transferase-like glycosyltransferase
MTPLRIIMLSYERGFLDPASEASQRLARLFSDDVKITVVLLSKVDILNSKFQIPNSLIVRSGSVLLRLPKLCLAAIKEIRAAKKRGERVLVTAQDPFVAGSMAFRLSRIMDVPYEIQEHGDFYSGYWEKEIPFVNRFFWLIGCFVLRRADGVRAVSQRVKDHLIRRCGVDPDRVIVNPVANDLSWHFNHQPRPWPEAPTIVCPCRFVRQKGIETLIDAFDRLERDGVKFRARLIGKGPLEPWIRGEIARRGLADRVAIESWTLNPDAEWADADLFVCASRYEGWGRTITEAMAAGIPIVTTDVGCVGSILRPQLDGRVVQPDDAESLARVIKEQLEERDRRTWMAENARARIRETISSPEDSVRIQHEAWERTQQSNNPAIKQSRPSRRAWISTTLLIASASLIRLASFLLFWKTLGSNREWSFFSIVQNWFLGYGYSMVSAAGCASAYRSPGYLFFLTGVYGIFGFANFFAQALIQNLLAILLVYLVYRLGWSVSKDRRIGLVAGFLIAVHPYTFYHYTQYYHTVLSGCFLVGLLLVLLALERTKKMRWAVLGGILIASLAYIQGTILPATALLSVWLFVRWWPDWKRAIGAIAVMALVSVAMIAPWTYRNWKVFHAFVPLTTDLGHALAKANHPLNYAMTALGYPQEAFEENIDPSNPLLARYSLLPEVQADLRAHGIQPAENYFFGPEHPVEPGLRLTCEAQSEMNEVEFNAYWTSRAKAWMAANYWPEVVKLQVQKIVDFWSPVLSPGKKYGAAWSFGNEGLMATLARNGVMAYVLVAEIFALIGIVIASRKKRIAFLVPIVIIFIVYTALHSFFAGYTKYRIPLDNLLVILSSFGIVGIWEMVARKKHR